MLKDKKQLELSIYSFSYKKGIPADSSDNGGGYVFDCRAIHNPGRYEPYKQLTGRDKEVINFLEKESNIADFLKSVYALLDAHCSNFIERGFQHIQVCFGCTGGQHRSVYCAEHLAEHLVAKFDLKISLEHRELGIKKQY